MQLKLDIQEVADQDKLPYSLLHLADDSEEMIRLYTSRGATYVAKHGTEVVGSIVVMQTRPFTLEIMNVAVLPEYERKGICRRMFEHVESVAQAQGAKTIEVGTSTAGTAQILIYQKLGYRVSGVDADYFVRVTGAPALIDGREYPDMIRLIKHL
jgi:ribosomal protein S18 acetylase RimI-like enzyme